MSTQEEASVVWRCSGCGQFHRRRSEDLDSPPASCDICGATANFQDISAPGIIEFPPITPPDAVSELLSSRGRIYGSFAENSSYAERFLEVIQEAQQKRSDTQRMLLTSPQANALIMIAQKMSRILSAPDPTYADNWDDIAGYARLGRDGT